MATPYVAVAAVPHRQVWKCVVRPEPNARWIRVTGENPRPNECVDVSTRPGLACAAGASRCRHTASSLADRLALLSGEPETTELPLRRFAYALFGGLVVGAVLVAGFGIYGLLGSGGRRPVEEVQPPRARERR